MAHVKSGFSLRRTLKAVRVAAVAGAGVLLIGCGAPVRIPVQVMHPAEINMSPFKQIVMGEVGGNLSRGFGDGVKEQLVDSAQFKVVDRSQLRQILGEQSLSQSDLADPKKRIKVGKLLSGAALITGHTEGSVKTELTQKNMTCQRVIGKDSKGKAIWQEYGCTQYTRSSKSVTSGSVDVVSVTSGEIVKSKRLGGSCSQQTQATDAQPADIDEGELLGCALGENIRTFVKAISPWTETVSVPFFTDSGIPELEKGIRHAQMGELAEATKIFLDSAKLAEGNPKIKPKVIAKAYGNLGYSYKLLEKFDEATAAFKKAYMLNPDDNYLAEQQAVKHRRAELAELKRQGVTR